MRVFRMYMVIWLYTASCFMVVGFSSVGGSALTVYHIPLSSDWFSLDEISLTAFVKS